MRHALKVTVLALLLAAVVSLASVQVDQVSADDDFRTESPAATGSETPQLIEN
jgi:hypothetical protein